METKQNFKIDNPEKLEVFYKYYKYYSGEFSWEEAILVKEAKEATYYELLIQGLQTRLKLN